MQGNREALAALHQLYLELHTINDELERAPRQIKVRERKVGEAAQNVEDLKDKLKQLRAAADRKSLDLKSKEANLDNLQGKLNSATNNKEFAAVKQMIDADEAAKSVLEDEVLETLDKVDSTQVAIGKGEEQAQQLKSDTEAFIKQFEQKAEVLRSQAAELEAKIAEADKFISGETRIRYQRVVDSMGADGLASIQKGVCSGCFVSLTPQATVVVNSGALVFCFNCGRLQYGE